MSDEPESNRVMSSLEYLASHPAEGSARARETAHRLFSHAEDHREEAEAMLAEYLYVTDTGQAAVPASGTSPGFPAIPEAGGSLAALLDEQEVP